MRNKTWIVILLVSIMNGVTVFAQKTDRSSTRYDWKEQWFAQVQAGGSYMCAENIRFGSFFKGTGASYAVSLGKFFTPVWGMRMKFFGGGDKGKYYSDKSSEAVYRFSHVGGTAEVMFDLLNCFRDGETAGQSRWDFNLILGPGVVHTYNFDRKGEEYAYGLNASPRNHFMLYGGAEVQYRLDRHWGLSLEAGTEWMRDEYNGVVYGRGLDGHLGVLLGVRYVFWEKVRTGGD